MSLNETHCQGKNDRKLILFVIFIDNTKCKDAVGCGKWERPQVKNPKYKGKWRPAMIDNPDYKVCSVVRYRFRPGLWGCKHLGCSRHGLFSSSGI